ncbi:hypothetical protein Hanom_Chr01g00066851 [Helianthus anomalus]
MAVNHQVKSLKKPKKLTLMMSLLCCCCLAGFRSVSGRNFDCRWLLLLLAW